MTRKRKIILLSVVCAFALPALASAASTKPFYYGAWIPFWQSQAGAQDLAVNLDKMNEVSPFSYEIGNNGALIDDLNIDNGSWAGWFSAVSELNVKIIPTIADFNASQIYNMLSVTKTRQAEEDTIAQLVTAQKFNGIDIDFEGMVAGTKPYFSLFIEGLAMRLHPAGDVVTCTVEPRTPATSLAGGIASDSNFSEDYTALSKYCDEIRVMAYDQSTIDTTLDATKGDGTLYAPTADPDWVSAVIQQTLLTVPASKVMLGIPTYGYEYEVSWADGVTTYQRVRAFDFMDAMDRADSMGIEPMRNNADELSFTYASTTYIPESPALTYTTFSAEPAVLTNPDPNATTTFFVTFPDATSIADEIALAKDDGLRGVILFKADGDIDPGIWGQMTPR